MPLFTVLAIPAHATPGTPGVPQAPTLIFSEDFQNTPSTAPQSILDYTGVTGMTYTADTIWTPAAQACNGWVGSQSSLPPANNSATGDTGCYAGSISWSNIQSMAYQLGIAEGMSSAEAASNNALVSYTNSTTPQNYNGIQLETKSSISVTEGHFYNISSWFAEMNCFSNHAKEFFYILYDNDPGSSVLLNNQALDPCGTVTTGTTQVETRQLQAPAILLPSGVTSLGFQVVNTQSSGNGNDVVFDLPQILDVTPQLDKSFNPAAIITGQPSTLTFTITNTSELGEKDGWSFTDSLPAGLRVAAVPNLTLSCASVNATAAAGATSITVAGNLTAGTAYCTVTVDVTSTTAGTYTNGPANITGSVGVLPPGTATLTVTPPPAIPALRDPRLLALLASMLGGLAWFARRAERR